MKNTMKNTRGRKPETSSANGTKAQQEAGMQAARWVSPQLSRHHKKCKKQNIMFKPINRVSGFGGINYAAAIEAERPTNWYRVQSTAVSRRTIIASVTWWSTAKSSINDDTTQKHQPKAEHHVQECKPTRQPTRGWSWRAMKQSNNKINTYRGFDHYEPQEAPLKETTIIKTR